MTTTERRAPVQPGEPAPDFTLPAANREGGEWAGDSVCRSVTALRSARAARVATRSRSTDARSAMGSRAPRAPIFSESV
jgi:hypothetical protein